MVKAHAIYQRLGELGQVIIYTMHWRAHAVSDTKIQGFINICNGCLKIGSLLTIGKSNLGTNRSSRGSHLQRSFDLVIKETKPDEDSLMGAECQSSRW